MKGRSGRGADDGDERMQRRLREIAERAEREERALPPMTPRAPDPTPPTYASQPSRAYAPSTPPPPPSYPAMPFPVVTTKRRIHRGWLFTLPVLVIFLFSRIVSGMGGIGGDGPQGWTSTTDRDTKFSNLVAPVGTASSPLGRPPTNVPDADTYIFMHKQPGTGEPVTYDPCAPIHYVVNDRTAFAGVRDELDAAIDQVEKATGLVFVDDGETDEAPIDDRGPRNEEHYGKSWSPVLVSFSDAKEYPGLDGRIVGRGGSVVMSRGSQLWNVSGQAVFDGPELRRIYRGLDGPAQVRAILMHELGHVVGLGHVSDRREIMKPVISRKITTWGPGDRAGLARLGLGNCMTY
ncbi:matrixin family metalloprotease [Aeromicrobium ginsengisoli]|uniref:matrixin family metalloprotease n=1 Tax=Aeromicrobium ginsengisoli TaxID=363867 RepID=UPI00165FFB98|nr:matrixin family metalloprotease [Aeromicrobium ginsengisoli]